MKASEKRESIDFREAFGWKIRRSSFLFARATVRMLNAKQWQISRRSKFDLFFNYIIQENPSKFGYLVAHQAPMMKKKARGVIAFVPIFNYRHKIYLLRGLTVT